MPRSSSTTSASPAPSTLAWMAAIHVLETQRDPAALVVGPQQARHRSGDGQRATIRASRRCKLGESGFAASLTALMNTRRSSSRRSRAASPGENPVGCVIDATTGEARRSSSAARTSAGKFSQSTRSPFAAG